MIEPSYHPSLFEVNTRTWLQEISRATGKPPTLDNVPDDALDSIAERGFDWLWMMGVWQTGQIGRQIASSIPELRQEFRRILPDFTDADICGSPFAIQAYHVHHDFGGDAALRRFQQRLEQRGIRLMLDFVPNHTAIDHPWATRHPEYYIQGKKEDWERRPRDYYTLLTDRGRRYLAHGRDPYFPPWSDTLQLNYRVAELRQAMVAELEYIAGMCAGVRCDMAMLLLPEVILRTWSDQSLPAYGNLPVDDPFWPEAIQHVRGKYPQFLFMAEVYWDLEPKLMEQGFDYTYDKVLYDHLRSGSAGSVRQHLSANPQYQDRLVRFLENHDEQRAVLAFPGEMGFAAALLCYLVPGLRFFHQGQLEGHRLRLPVQLCRPPVEAPDESISAFYEALLDLFRRDVLRHGVWHLLDCRPLSQDDHSWSNLIALSWSNSKEATEIVVVVNYGPYAGRCAIRPQQGLPWQGASLIKLLASQVDGMVSWLDGRLSCDLPAWGFQVLEVVEKT